MSYTYRAYPRMLHNQFGEQRSVKSEAEEKAAAADGWFADTSKFSVRNSILEEIEKHETTVATLRLRLSEMDLMDINAEEQAATLEQVEAAEGFTRNIPKTTEERNQELINQMFGVENAPPPADPEATPDTTSEGFQCGVCGRTCASRLGLAAHHRSHKG